MFIPETILFKKINFKVTWETHIRGVATNSGLGARFKSGPFLYRKYEGDIKESNVYSSC